MRQFVIDEPVYKTATLFIVGCSHERLSVVLKRRYRVDVGDDVGQVGQMFTFTSPPFRVVWSQARSLPIVLHEVFHLVTRICEDRGIPIKAHGEHGESSDEAAAFLFEFYVRNLVKRVWE